MTYGMVPFLPFSSLGSSDGQESRQSSPAPAARQSSLRGMSAPAGRTGSPVHHARSLHRRTSDRQSTPGGGHPLALPQTPLQRRWDRRTFTAKATCWTDPRTSSKNNWTSPNGCAQRHDRTAIRALPLRDERLQLLWFGGRGGADVVFAEQEGEEHVAQSSGDRQRFVEERAGECDRASRGRLVEMRGVLGEAQVSALVTLVLEREREPAVRGGEAQVVAVGAEVAARGAVITGDLEALEARGAERKRL